MALFETWLKSDLKKPLKVEQLKGNLFSSDSGGNQIGVEVLDNGSPATLTGGVMGYVIRADGATVAVNGSLSGNRASIVLPGSAYVVTGQVSIAIKVGSTTVGACSAYVYRTTTDSLVDPGHVIPSIEELLAKIADCEAATTAAESAASSANTAASTANTAATGADTAAGSANTAAGSANTAASTANAAAQKIDGMTVAASGLPAGSSPTAAVSEVSGHKHIAFGIPKGDTGETPDFTIGEVETLLPGEEAYVELDESSTPEEPVLNFGIPQGNPGSITDAFASNIAMSPTDPTTVKDAMDEKMDEPETAGTDGQVLTSDGEGGQIWKDMSLDKYREASGSIVHVEDAVAEPVKSLVVEIAPVQSGTGDPSPSNVRSIVGWTGANVGCTGKNLLGGIALADAVVSSMPSATINTTSKCVNFAANATAVTAIVGTANSGKVCGFKFKEEMQYTFVMTYDKNEGETASTNLRISYTDGTSSDFPTISSATEKGTVVLVSDAGKTIKSFYKRNASGTTHLYYEESGIFEGVLTAQDFEEWVGTVYPVTFPTEVGTVYGGTLTVNKDGTGQLVVDMMIGEITASDISSTTSLGDNRRTNIIRPFPYATTGENAEAISNMLPRVTKNYSTDVTGFYIDGTNAMYAKFPIASLSEDSTDGVKALLTATPLIVCCPIKKSARPVYNLTELQVIEALQGINNFFADTGGIHSLVYPINNYALTEDLEAGLNKKVDKNQGAQNAGKTLGINAQGMVEPVSLPDFTGATSSTDGAHGCVPAPSAGDQDKVLMGDGTWSDGLPGAVEGVKSSLALVENGDTATQNIAKGKYVLWKGVMCRAASAISSGDTLSSTNLTEVSGGGLNDLPAFEDVSKCIFRGNLYNTHDANNLEDGIYYIASTLPAHAPTGYNWSVLYQVTVADTMIHQYVFKPVSCEILMREYSGNPAAWGDWRSATGYGVSWGTNFTAYLPNNVALICVNSYLRIQVFLGGTTDVNVTVENIGSSGITSFIKTGSNSVTFGESSASDSGYTITRNGKFITVTRGSNASMICKC